MRVLILHHVGKIKIKIGLFNYPKDQDEILPWETENEVSEFQQDYDLLKFKTKTKPPNELLETSYSIKKIQGSYWWEGTFKIKIGKTETEGECTCFIFE